MNFSAKIPFSKIFLYIDSRIGKIDPHNLEKFFEEKTSTEVELEENFLQNKNRKGLARRVVYTKVRDKRERKFKKPLPKEVDLEKKVIEEDKELLGIIYDGHRLVKLLRGLLSQDEKENHTIIITKRLFGTLEMNESRYHIRTVINSIPSIISTSGIVEGPAKPRKYYFTDKDERDEILDFRPMTYSDERMETAVKSYLLQTVFWRLLGDPSCDKEGCRLYNSHWQRELIENQIKGELCEEHKDRLQQFKKR
ncbi:MAG: hypothetical protein KGY66_00210 [Candidatus Thermoplasmatota archaeon]|nr:hypothetical protein [Candidatus Thermoplasmatota archaeon]MBS3789326.1 hypothetical protein [Candidatus Thermoplasmatota archaeon]